MGLFEWFVFYADLFGELGFGRAALVGHFEGAEVVRFIPDTFLGNQRRGYRRGNFRLYERD